MDKSWVFGIFSPWFLLILLCPTRVGRAVPEAPGLIAGLNDMAVMRQAIQQRRRHLRVPEHIAPLQNERLVVMITLVRS